MAKPNPLWRQAFDAVEKPLRDRVETLAGTREFGRAMMLAFEAWTTVGRTARGTSTYLLHLANLPAHADLRRVARQLGALESKVDKLTADLERMESLLERSPGERPRRAAK